MQSELEIKSEIVWNDVNGMGLKETRLLLKPRRLQAERKIIGIQGKMGT